MTKQITNLDFSRMYLIVLAWAYIVVLMAATEATSSTGTMLGAVFTLLLYGVLPIGLVMYIFGTPARKRALRAAQAAQDTAAADAQNMPEASALPALDPDTGRHAPADAVAAVAEKAPRLGDRAPGR
ncbi:MAG: hypothetical protein ACT4NV_15915 [Rhodoferax sp.]